MLLKTILTNLSFRRRGRAGRRAAGGHAHCGLVREGGELAGHPAVASFDAIDPRRY